MVLNIRRISARHLATVAAVYVSVFVGALPCQAQFAYSSSYGAYAAMEGWVQYFDPLTGYWEYNTVTPQTSGGDGVISTTRTLTIKTSPIDSARVLLSSSAEPTRGRLTVQAVAEWKYRDLTPSGYTNGEGDAAAAFYDTCTFKSADPEGTPINLNLSGTGRRLEVIWNLKSTF